MCFIALAPLCIRGQRISVVPLPCTQVRGIGAFPQPCIDSALFPSYSTGGPRRGCGGGKGAHYQSSPGKYEQAARAAPLPINAFTPSKPLQCKSNPFGTPARGKAHLGQPEPAAHTPLGPGAPPLRRGSPCQLSAVLARQQRPPLALAAAARPGRFPSSRRRSPRSPLCPAPPRAAPSVALPGAPGRETHRRGRRGGGTRLWEPRSGTSGRGCAGRERGAAERGAVEARGQRGAAWTRGPGLRPGARAPPSAPARPDGARGRGIAPGRLMYALVPEEPFREASAQRGLPLVPRDGWRGIYK